MLDSYLHTTNSIDSCNQGMEDSPFLRENTALKEGSVRPTYRKLFSFENAGQMLVPSISKFSKCFP